MSGKVPRCTQIVSRVLSGGATLVGVSSRMTRTTRPSWVSALAAAAALFTVDGSSPAKTRSVIPKAVIQGTDGEPQGLAMR